MREQLFFALAATLLVALPTPGEGATRVWTNSKGQKVEAELLEASETTVVLKIKGSGQEYRMAPVQLSAPDREFIKKWLEENSGGGSGKTEPTGEFENWGDDWPELISTDIDPEITVVKEDDEAKEYIYQSPNYEFICDVQLATSVVKRFSVLFEATNEYIRALPLSMEKARSGKRHKILLFETKNSYVQAGGPASSAGVYMPGKDVIMVPLTSLGVKKVGSRYQVDYDEGNKTLPHEITHQITDRAYYGFTGWFTEGLAEYIGVTPYRGGKFMVRTVRNSLKDYVTAYGRDGDGGRAIGEEVNLPPLKDWMQQSYGSFLANPQVNYGCGALITYYFFHMDGEKDAARIKKALATFKEGKKPEEAYAALLDGRTWDEMEKDITNAWRGRGVKFNFPD